MRLKGFLLLLLGVVLTYGSLAQKPGELTQSRILILLDGSSSMTQPWLSGKVKFKAATDIILRLMDSVYAVNKDVEFSLRVFGHQYTVAENNCQDTRNEVPFRKDNRLQMEYRLDAIKPLGVTSIAYSLKQAAANDLVDPDHNAYSIVLITDGGESCGGNICEVMRMLISKKVYFRPYIVSLEDYPGLKQEYDCMGDYLQVTKDAEITKAVTTIVDAFRPALKITATDYKELQTIAAKAPSILKVNVPPIKDSVAAPKPVTTAWSKPPAVVIDKLTVRERMLTTRDVLPEKLKLLTGIPGMPEIEVERAPNEAIGRITYAGPRRLPVPALSATAPAPVTRFPVLPDVEPDPQPPVPENIVRVIFANNRSLNIPTRPDATLSSVSVPPLTAIEAEVIRPQPESISRISIGALRSIAVSTRAVTPVATVANLAPLPDVTPEVVIPSPEQIVRLSLHTITPLANERSNTAIPNLVTLPGLPDVVPEITIPAPEKVTRLTMAGNTLVVSQPRIPVTFTTAALPPLPDVTPEVSIPAPERITNLALAKPALLQQAARAIAALPTAPLPPLPVVEPEITRPSPETLAKIALQRSSPLLIEMREIPVITTVHPPALPAFVPEVERPAAERIAAIQPGQLRTVATRVPPVTMPGLLLSVPSMPEIAPEAPPRVPEPAIAKLRTSRVEKAITLWVFDEVKLTERQPPPMPALKLDPPPAPPAPKLPTTKTVAGKLPEPTAKKVDYTVATEDAQETSLQIFFTDGHGKFYPTTPQMLMLDPSTQNIVKKFYRNVDANGNPDPIPGITPGSYDITLSLSRDMIAFNVKIEPNKKNTLTMRVPPASLSFEYAEPANFSKPSKRPVTEFKAMVIERNKAQGRVQMQECTKSLEYEPGNYNVQLNTFPEDMRNISLDFGHHVITLPQPGFAKFTDQVNVRTATLWKRDGDRFAKFFTLDLSSPIAQNMQIQPGEYQVHYQKGPGGTLTEKVKPFIVRSVQNTEVIID